MVIEKFRILSRSEYKKDYQSSVIATLGPSGTSSEFVALELSKHVALFPSYELAEQYLQDTSDDAVLLVANAYRDINKFYISRRTRPAGAFFCDTPPYVLASRLTRVEDMPSQPRISSHRAPAHLLDQILTETSFSFVEADSTSAAARMVADCVVDACITTKIACDLEGLNALYDTGTIPMLWTIFEKK